MVFRCREFNEDGSLVHRGCRNGKNCKFVHPDDPLWPESRHHHKPAPYDPRNNSRKGKSSDRRDSSDFGSRDKGYSSSPRKSSGGFDSSAWGGSSPPRDANSSPSRGWGSSSHPSKWSDSRERRNSSSSQGKGKEKAHNDPWADIDFDATTSNPKEKDSSGGWGDGNADGWGTSGGSGWGEASGGGWGDAATSGWGVVAGGGWGESSKSGSGWTESQVAASTSSTDWGGRSGRSGVESSSKFGESRRSERDSAKATSHSMSSGSPSTGMISRPISQPVYTPPISNPQLTTPELPAKEVTTPFISNTPTSVITPGVEPLDLSNPEVLYIETMRVIFEVLDTMDELEEANKDLMDWKRLQKSEIYGHIPPSTQRQFETLRYTREDRVKKAKAASDAALHRMNGLPTMTTLDFDIEDVESETLRYIEELKHWLVDIYANEEHFPSSKVLEPGGDTRSEVDMGISSEMPDASMNKPNGLTELPPDEQLNARLQKIYDSIIDFEGVLWDWRDDYKETTDGITGLLSELFEELDEKESKDIPVLQPLADGLEKRHKSLGDNVEKLGIATPPLMMRVANFRLELDGALREYKEKEEICCKLKDEIDIKQKENEKERKCLQSLTARVMTLEQIGQKHSMDKQLKELFPDIQEQVEKFVESILLEVAECLQPEVCKGVEEVFKNIWASIDIEDILRPFMQQISKPHNGIAAY